MDNYPVFAVADLTETDLLEPLAGHYFCAEHAPAGLALRRVVMGTSQDIFCEVCESV